MDLPTVLALDTGGTTGYCCVIPHKPPIQGELGPKEHHVELWDLMLEYVLAADDHHTALHIVCEAFQFRHDDRDRSKIDYMAAHYEGVVELFHAMNQTRYAATNLSLVLVKQSASQVKGQGKKGPSKTFWGDDSKVKQVDLWVPGKPHAVDATRHYLYYVSFALDNDYYLRKLK